MSGTTASMVCDLILHNWSECTIGRGYRIGNIIDRIIEQEECRGNRENDLDPSPGNVPCSSSMLRKRGELHVHRILRDRLVVN